MKHFSRTDRAIGKKANYNPNVSKSPIVVDRRRKSALLKGKMSDNAFKAMMFVAIATAIVFIVALVVFIFQFGISGFDGRHAEAN